MPKIFLDPNDTKFKLSNPASVYGGSGAESLIIETGTTGVTVDGNVERVDFAGAVSDFTFVRATNKVEVYKGGQLVGTIAMQGDADGSQLVFSDGSVQLQFTAGVMTLGGTAVPTSAPGPVVPTTIDTATKSDAGTGTGVTPTLVAGAASVDEGSSATFTLSNASANTTYTYNISGVESSDITGGSLTGSVTTDATGKGTISVATVADRLTEGVQTMTVSLPNSTLTASTKINDTSLNNIAPVANAATLAIAEDGAAVNGQLVATDADGDAITYALSAPVEGLTLNADGSYTFNPLLNTAVQALKYDSAPLVITANYTATDNAPVPGTSASTLTITATPKPLSFSLVGSAAFVEEGSTVKYTLVASEAVKTATTGTIQVVAGDGTTGQTAANDFGSGSLNPVTVTIAAGATTSTAMTLTPSNDSATEMPEAYSVKGTVTGYTIENVAGEVRDPSTVGGLGQTFTLTKNVDAIPGLIGSAGSTGTDGNDTITGTGDTATAAANNVSTFTALDNIDGGLGTDTFNLSVVADTFTTVGLGATVKNVEIVNVQAVKGVTVDSSAWVGVTNLNVTKSVAAAVLTAANTTDISVAGGEAAVTTNGGKSITITQAMDLGADVITVKGGGDVTVTATDSAAGTIDIGNTTAVTGAVVVSSTGPAVAIAKDGGATAVAMGAITVNGGTTVSVTQNANSVSGTAAANVDNVNDILTQGAVTVTGGAATTTVTVVQSDQVAAVAAQAAAGANQTQTVTFEALVAKNTVTVNGLTFTAAVNMTAAEVAQAFAGLTSGDSQDDGGPTAKGIYTGTNTAGFITGPAVGATVTYTEVIAGTNAAPIVVATAQNGGVSVPTAPTVAAGATGVTTAAAITGVLGVANGAVIIDDTAAKTITTVTVDGYSAGVTIGNTVAASSLDKITTLTLKNSGAGTALLNTDSVGSLTLNLTDVDAAVNLDGGVAGLTSLTINTSGVASTGAITASTVKNVTINSEAALSGAHVLTAATGITVNGTATVDLTGAITNAATLLKIDASGNSGGVTAVLGAANSLVFTGGSGADSLTLGAAAIADTKNIDMGLGNDTLTVFTGTTATTIVGTVKGGGGTDTLSMGFADAVAVSADGGFHAEVTGFERLTINNSVGANSGSNVTYTVNLANLAYNYVTVNGTYSDADPEVDTLSLTGMAANGTVNFGALSTAGSLYTVALADATGSTDMLNYVLASTTGAGAAANGVLGTAINAGTITANLVETFNITSSAVDLDGATNVITANGDSVKTIMLTGNGGVTLGATNVTTLKTVDASGLTGTGAAGGLTFTAGSASMTVTGGAGNDTLNVGANADSSTFIGGNGNDTFTVTAGADLVTLNGGAGTDIFDFNGVSTNKSNYTVISSVDTGDKIDLAGLAGGITGFAATKITLAVGATETTQAYLDQAMATLSATEAGWFQMGGNTYVVADVGGESAAAFADNTDFVVMIVGSVNLSTASFNATSDTLEFA